jgi:hypothetical protein
MIHLILAIGLLSAAGTSYAATDVSTIFPAAAQITSLASLGDWGGLRSACDKDLKVKAYPLGDFSPAPHYDDKGVNPNDSRAAIALGGEAMAVYRLGVCYQISHNRKYAAKAESLLDSWATSLIRIGSEQGVADINFSVPYALMAAYVLKNDSTWDSGRFTNMVRNTIAPANNMHRVNNHGNWGVLLELTAGAYLNDGKMVATARDRWLELMRNEVASDGSLPQEICRSNNNNWCGGPTKGMKGISYEHWTLLPVTLAAEIFRNMGLDVYTTPEGALLHRAYRKAAAWTLHPETFPYYAANHGQLEGIYGADYFYILQRVFPEPDGAAVIHSGNVQGNRLYLREMYGAK